LATVKREIVFDRRVTRLIEVLQTAELVVEFDQTTLQEDATEHEVDEFALLTAQLGPAVEPHRAVFVVDVREERNFFGHSRLDQIAKGTRLEGRSRACLGACLIEGDDRQHLLVNHLRPLGDHPAGGSVAHGAGCVGEQGAICRGQGDRIPGLVTVLG